MAAGISLLLHASLAADPRFGSVSLAAPAPAPLTSVDGHSASTVPSDLSQQLLWPWQVAMLNGHLFSGYLRAGPPLALPGPQNIDPVRHPFGQMLPPAMLAPAAALNLGAAALSSDPLRPQYEELRAGGLGDVSRLGLAPDPLATPLYWSPFSPVPRRGRPNLLRRFFAPGFMGMGGV